jgi:transposase InsO family protein
MDYTFIIIVDAHSKWQPHILVSDNAGQFKSMEFEEFLKQNWVHHKFSAPYHPATNGQAERFVQIMKQSLRSMSNEPGDINIKLNWFLMQYRITPHTTTKRSPSELMFGRNIRSRLNIMRSNVQQEVHANAS